MQSLTLSEFQKLAARTLPLPGEQKFFGPASANPDTFRAYDRNVDLLHALLGLAGEVGELIDPVKKAMFYGKPLDVENITEETGDLLWYIAGPLCRALGADLGQIAAANVAKLRERYPDNYTDAAAIERADKGPKFPAHIQFPCPTCPDGNPIRKGYRYRDELTPAQVAAAYKAMGSGTCEDGYFYGEDARAWVPVEALWEPVTEEAHGEQIDREVSTADGPALEIVLHLLRMGAASGQIPVECDGEHFVVSVKRGKL